MKAGYVEFSKKKKVFIAADFGVPQGGLISPLLSNVILHELDVYIENRKKEFISQSLNQPSKHRNLVYGRLSNLVHKARKAGLRAEERATLSLRSRVSPSVANPLYSRIEYTRYADDWLVGV